MATPSVARRGAASDLPVRWWWGFAPYALLTLVHVVARAIPAPEVADPTKLGLMPLLAVAVLWAGRGSRWGAPYTLLFVAIALSWLGDGAETFFAGLPTVPMMLLCFGLAHVAYVVLFVRYLARHRLPRWAAVYAVWWIVLLAVLMPILLAQSNGWLWVVALGTYGLLLGATAVTATRCHPLVAVGAAFFLSSDSVLAFRLFAPDAMPDWTSPLVMITYCVGQGLIAAGVIVSTRVVARAESA